MKPLSIARRNFKALINLNSTEYKICDISNDDLPSNSTVIQSPGSCELLINTLYSTINYKDSLVITGKWPGELIVPLVPGIDLVGTVEQDSSNTFKTGDEIVVNGWGIGTNHWGGLAQKARVRAEWATLLPHGVDALDAAKIGTAGYTSMICVDNFQLHGITPENGPILVTGATGGVGTTSILMLAQLGYEVVALTAKDSQAQWLKSLGASEVLSFDKFIENVVPLDTPQFAGCIENTCTKTINAVLSRMLNNGIVNLVGRATGNEISTTVFPFILRGTSLLGIDSVFQAQDRRQRLYSEYGSLLTGEKLELISGRDKIVGLSKVKEVCQLIQKAQHTGRYVVDLNLE